ncbi:hypothetical protein JCM3774_000754 [Rhodotorula dairenensis]
MFKRALNATAPALKPQPATPLRRVRDPLLSSRSAEHYTLESGHSFIVRPPPSVVPPSHPLLPQPAADAEHGRVRLAAKLASSPFGASLPLSSSSSLLPLDHYSIENQHRLPSTRGPTAVAGSTSTKLSADEIARLQSLRRSDPVKWTRSALAREFRVPQHVVGMFGWGAGAEARLQERQRRRQVEAERKALEDKQGWKRTIAREERRRRRSMW